MNASVRACIAYAVGRGVSGKEFSGVCDYSQSKQLALTGSVTADHTDVESVTLEIRNDSFRGCDHRSSFHFTGKVQPESVNLYDCENGLSFRFGI
ncbi:MAG: hypothetical protein ACLQU1_38105 [Bryobacteraceae bacterium]